jgi:hypothetical protein
VKTGGEKDRIEHAANHNAGTCHTLVQTNQQQDVLDLHMQRLSFWWMRAPVTCQEHLSFGSSQNAGENIFCVMALQLTGETLDCMLYASYIPFEALEDCT